MKSCSHLYSLLIVHFKGTGKTQEIHSINSVSCFSKILSSSMILFPPFKIQIYIQALSKITLETGDAIMLVNLNIDESS